jgi:anti-sigma regulatory factor (Ser/Thr protein kinase)
VRVAAEHALPRNNDAPGMARDIVQALHCAVPDALVDDAALLVSELVSNGVKYGGEGELRLQIEAASNRIRAEILDQGSGFEPLTRAKRNMTLTDEGGWGLHLVESLADDWGVHAGSTQVWFEIRRA